VKYQCTNHQIALYIQRVKRHQKLTQKCVHENIGYRPLPHDTKKRKLAKEVYDIKTAIEMATQM